MHELIPKNEDYLSEGEVKEALEALSQADLLRLGQVARRFEGRGCSGDDLLQEAILRVLDGTRVWKRGMRAAPFLYSAMKSIADAGYKKKTVENNAESSTDAEGNEKVSVSAARNEVTPSAEEALIQTEKEEAWEQGIKARLSEVQALFQGHEHANWVLMGQMDGCAVKEVCEMSGMTRTQYDSARRHIRRTLDKNFPNGWRIR